MKIEDLKELTSGDTVYYLGEKSIVNNSLGFDVEITMAVVGDLPNTMAITEENVKYLFLSTPEIEKIARFFKDFVSPFLKDKPCNLNPKVNEKIQNFWVKMCEASFISSSAYVDIKHDFHRFMNELAIIRVQLASFAVFGIPFFNPSE
ncbi:MAG: hypothetical protein WCO66_01935 [Candidatus Absconditabacteria bacterium]